MNTSNQRTRIFINSIRHELPFVRLIQIILENEHHYTTYIHELARFEGLDPDEYLHGNKNDLDEFVFDVVREEAISHDHVLWLYSSNWRRMSAMEYNALLGSLHRGHSDDIQFVVDLDIDYAYSLSVTALYDYIKEKITYSLGNPITGESGIAVSQHLIVTNHNDIPDREKNLIDWVAKLNQNFNQEDLWMAMHDTEGEIVSFVGAFAKRDIQVFNDEMPNELEDLPKLEYILSMWRHNKTLAKKGMLGAFTFNQSFKNLILNYLSLQFHVYPPHQLKGKAFISHSSRDLNIVRTVQYTLETWGIRTFVFRLGRLDDSDFSEQEEFSNLLDALRSEIVACDAVIYLMSSSFPLSPWTFIEEVFARIYEKISFYVNREHIPMNAQDFEETLHSVRMLFPDDLSVETSYADYTIIPEEALYHVMEGQKLADAFLRGSTNDELVNLARELCVNNVSQAHAIEVMDRLLRRYFKHSIHAEPYDYGERIAKIRSRHS